MSRVKPDYQSDILGRGVVSSQKGENAVDDSVVRAIRELTEAVKDLTKEVGEVKVSVKALEKENGDLKVSVGKVEAGLGNVKDNVDYAREDTKDNRNLMIKLMTLGFTSLGVIITLGFSAFSFAGKLP